MSDLNLPAMGANPNARDLFLEIDWLQNNGSVSYRPVAAAIDFVVNLFAAAPTGPVTVHLDAGARLSRNMGSNPALLQGGDAISDPAGHIEYIYFGVPGSMSSPPFVLRSFQELKDARFGTADKRAREFAFRYVILGDRGGVPGNENGGLGEVAFFADDQSIPGNDLLVAQGGVTSPPPFPNGFSIYQTVAHEIGHTVGLRHGGIDHVTSPPPLDAAFSAGSYKPDYLSLMNYSHTLGLPGEVAASTATSVSVMAPTTYSGINGLANFTNLDVLNVAATPPGSGDRRTISSNTFNQLVVTSAWTTNPVVNDTATVLRENFAGATDTVFNDWSAMDFGFSSSLDSIGTTFIADRSQPTSDPRPPEPGADELQNYYGPADLQLPQVTIVQPTAGSTVSSGTSFLVSSSVTDDFGVAGVRVRFDVNGDGTVSGSEDLVATLQPNNRWEAQPGPVSGPNGTRTVTVEATDVSGRFNEATVPVMVPEPRGIAMLISGSILVASLRRQRERQRRAR